MLPNQWSSPPIARHIVGFWHSLDWLDIGRQTPRWLEPLNTTDATQHPVRYIQENFSFVLNVCAGVASVLDLLHCSWLDAIFILSAANHTKGPGTRNMSECRIRSAILLTDPRDMIEVIKGRYARIQDGLRIPGSITMPSTRSQSITLFPCASVVLADFLVHKWMHVHAEFVYRLLG